MDGYDVATLDIFASYFTCNIYCTDDWSNNGACRGTGIWSDAITWGGDDGKGGTFGVITLGDIFLWYLCGKKGLSINKVC